MSENELLAENGVHKIVIVLKNERKERTQKSTKKEKKKRKLEQKD